MTYDPNICTPTMFEEELRALASSPAFADPQLDARIDAVGELRRAIKAVREVPGWSGESADTASGPLERMEKNASTIEATLEDLRTALVTSSVNVAVKANVALMSLPSASADGFLADAGRNLSGITDGWGVLDTGEAVAREEERLAAERESAAITKLKGIREALGTEAKEHFGPIDGWGSHGGGTIPLPVIDVEGIDSGVPPVGSNGPGAPGPGGGGGFPTPESPIYPNPGGTDPGTGPGPGPGPGGTFPTPGGTNPTLPDETGGKPDDPTVDSPGGGTLPGTPSGPGVWNPGGNGPGVWNPGGNGPGGSGPGGSGPGGYLPGGGTGGSVIGGVGSGVGGAATLLGGRAMAMGGLSGAAGMSGAGGIGGAAGSAPTSGRGLLGAAGAAGGSSASSSGAAASTSGTSAASTRPGGMGMMGGGAGGGSDKKGGRSTLGGPIAPELDIEDDERPRSRGAQAGSRNSAE